MTSPHNERLSSRADGGGGGGRQVRHEGLVGPLDDPRLEGMPSTGNKSESRGRLGSHGKERKEGFPFIKPISTPF